MIDNDLKLGYNDVMISPRKSNILSRNDVSLIRKFEFENGAEWEGVPIVAANMSTIGTFAMAEELAKHFMLTCVHKHYALYDWNKWLADIEYNPAILNYVAVSAGITQNDMDKLDSILALADIKFICLDVANGYISSFVNMISEVRKKYPKKIIIAGNVVTFEGTFSLIDAGANIIKIGIGPGSVCTTRRMTGVGYPQISAIDECEKATVVGKNYIMADGGCTTSGDIAKAFVAGADFVMLGGMLAAHDECGTTEFYGMSSQTALQKFGGLNNYRVSEGKTVTLEPRGSVNQTIANIHGGLRSTGTYINCDRIANFGSARLIRVAEQTNNVFGES